MIEMLDRNARKVVDRQIDICKRICHNIEKDSTIQARWLQNRIQSKQLHQSATKNNYLNEILYKLQWTWKRTKAIAITWNVKYLIKNCRNQTGCQFVIDYFPKDWDRILFQNSKYTWSIKRWPSSFSIKSAFLLSNYKITVPNEKTER